LKKITKGEITRLKILDVAEKEFAEAGFSKARLEDIAEKIGIQRAAVLHYFSTKQELYDQVEARIFNELQVHTDDRLGGITDPLEQLLALFDSWLDFQVARPTSARILMRNTADIEARARDPVEFAHGTLDTLKAIVLRCQKVGLFKGEKPMHLMALIGGGIMNYVCSAEQLGEGRAYRANDSRGLAKFRRLMHKAVTALAATEDD
jgi:TetR/AcrR family transcriptional regulator